MKGRAVFILALNLILSILLLGAAVPEVYFSMTDPAGDDDGYGTYQYPTNIAFQPYQGLFDILQFQVKAGQDETVVLDTVFRKVTNPWAAPEGFIHQNLRIFIDTIPGKGATVLPERGAMVRFHPKYAWDIGFKIVGWNNSQLFTLTTGALQARPLQVKLLDDGRTIRAEAPEAVIGKPSKNWHYYVLVGSYDGFGEDFFRKVAPKPGEWVIGGGSGAANNIEPRVMDLLAPANGKYSQSKQLRSFDPQQGRLAELYPVGADLSGVHLRGFFWGILVIVILGLMIYWFRRIPCAISWFWVKGKGEGKEVKS